VASSDEQRQRTDRRRQSRGGRRTDDRPGFAPLVLVADEESQSLEMCEAILAKLHFAVAPVSSVEKAVAIIDTLRPDVIVAHAKDVMPLQRAAWPSGVPFVTVTDEMRDPNAVVEAIRNAIRSARVAS
jgi:PleD family two-component response regulator